MSFKSDLQLGDKGEKAIMSLLKDNGFTDLSITQGNFQDYDIIGTDTQGNQKTYEVKTDYFYDTGNMAIEMFCLRRMKPTGVLGSKADWYVYIFDQARKAYFIKREELIDVLRTPQKGSVVNGGDGNQSVIFKLPRHNVQSIAKIVDVTKYLK